MPRQARWFVRTALLYLLAAGLVGGLVMAQQGLRLDARLGALTPVFYHLLTVGWLTQLICGVALWMFPQAARRQPHVTERLGWICYGALNGGLLIRSLAEPLLAWGWATGVFLAFSALLQVLAVWAFVFAIWPRVRARPKAADLQKTAP